MIIVTNLLIVTTQNSLYNQLLRHPQINSNYVSTNFVLSVSYVQTTLKSITSISFLYLHLIVQIYSVRVIHFSIQVRIKLSPKLSRLGPT